jgi:menaquinone-9 beta-reductase
MLNISRTRQLYNFPKNAGILCLPVTKLGEVIIIGGGPAGIVAAIAARRCGLRATVLDARKPPIDKACGEGILPQGVAALRQVGVSLRQAGALPFRGIRFVDEEHCTQADFAGATGYSIRRVKLHQLLVEHATETGVEFCWGARVTQIDASAVATANEKFPYRWLVGADGQNSLVRKWAGLETRVATEKRYGFCTHFRLPPWSDVAEVHWAHGCQIFVTPVMAEEVGIAVISRDPSLRLEAALQRFPALAKKLRGAERTTRESGDTTRLSSLPAVTRGRVALIGDASGTVDAVTGHGLSLSFQQAIALAEAMTAGDLSHYQIAHQKIATVPIAMTRLMLLMDRSDWIRRRTIRLLENSPGLFARMLEIHTEATPLSSVGVADIADFGWKFLRA